MKKSAAIYARYSSDLQNEASIDDQIRVCTEYAERNGWTVTNCFTDAGISGTSIVQRPGIQKLLQNAPMQDFQIVISEALDRISRDQEDVAHIFKRLTYEDIKMFTSSEGEITEMHIGLKGTMNALFIKDLAAKTHRGLRGRVEKGKSGGGIGYGYRVVKQFDANGEAIKGDREIYPEQAEVVRRIFQEYAHENKSAKAIAAQLNAEGIPAPSGGPWGQSTINGNRKRGIGILNNELYNGVLVWNRQRFIKDPATGRRVPRYNDESELIRKDIPELRIVPEALWDAAKAKQKGLKLNKGFHGAKRAQHLLSGLLVCGECAGGFAKVNYERYGCAAYRNKGKSVCTNNKTIKSDILENTILSALQTHIMNDEMLEVFCTEYTQHMKKLRSAQTSALKQHQKEQRKLVKSRANVIEAIKEGVPVSQIKGELDSISTRLDELEREIDLQQQPQPEIHTSLAQHYQEQVKELRTALTDTNYQAEAKERIRTLIDKIVLSPQAEKKGLTIDLYGDLAEILSAAAGKEKGNSLLRCFRLLEDLDKNHSKESETSNNLVAGAGFEPTTFGL